MMNERILELRTQAAAWVAENHQPQDPNAYSQQEIDQRYLMYEEKFAELIVRECGEYLMRPEFIGRSDLDWSMVLNEHFGVEE